FEWRLRLLVADDFAELRGIIIADRRIERGRTDRNCLKLRDFSTRNSDFIAELVIGRFATELFAHLQRYATHLGDFVHKVHRQPDGFALIRQRSLDGLLDPPSGVSAQLSALRRIEPFHRLHEPDVAFGDQIQQRQTKVRVVVCDLDHQTQVGANHQRTRLAIAFLDFSGQVDLLLWSQQWDLPDLTQVNLYSGIAIFSSHITLFHHSFGGLGSTTSRTLYSSMPSQSRVVAS